MSSARNVSVIDTATNVVIATVPVGFAPSFVAVNPAGTRAYVTNDGSANVSVLDTGTNTVIATVTVGDFPIGVAVTPNGTRVYVANLGGTVSVVDTATNTVVATVTVGETLFGLAIGPAASLEPPGGPVGQIPTLSEWGLILAALLVLSLGVRQLTRRVAAARERPL